MEIKKDDLELIKKLERHITLYDNTQDSGLMTGYAGLSLFYHELYKKTGDKSYQKKFDYCLERIYDSIFNDILSFDLNNGLTGIVWLLKFIEKNDQRIKIDSDFYHDITILLKTSFREALKENNWDYIKGALGCFQVLDDEDLYAELFSHIEHNLNSNGEILSKYYYKETNLGLPYGIAALLYFCKIALKYKKLRDKANNLINNIILILDKNEQKIDNLVFYPAMNGQKNKCRLAWCYGELTIAYQLLLISEYTNDVNLRLKAIKIAKDSTNRIDLEDAMIYDTCLQHGAIGNYLLYKLFSEKSNEEIFQITSEYWKKVTIEMLNTHEYLSINRYTLELYQNNSLLEGLAGVGLSLMADKDSDWLSIILLK